MNWFKKLFHRHIWVDSNYKKELQDCMGCGERRVWSYHRKEWVPIVVTIEEINAIEKQITGI